MGDVAGLLDKLEADISEAGSAIWQFFTANNHGEMGLTMSGQMRDLIDAAHLGEYARLVNFADWSLRHSESLYR